MTQLGENPDGAAARAARIQARQERRAANQAEREARREERRAERRAPEAVTPASEAPAEGAARQGFNILVVAQAGRLERQAVLFAASLIRNSPRWRGHLIVAEPREEGGWAGQRTRLSDPARRLLQELGAEIRPFTARHFGQHYPHGNKIEALAVLPEGEPFVFFDSDTLVTGPLEQIAFDFSRPAASMRRTGTWPVPPLYGPGPDDIWKSLYDRFGLDFASSLDLTQPHEHWERYLYFNAGWFLGADPGVFGRRFLDYALAVLEEPGEALACQSLDPWLDQVVLPLVIHSLGGGRPGPELSGLDGAATCHYRNLSLLYAREPEPVVTLVEDLLSQPRIAPLFAEDEAVIRLVRQGEGRATVRRHFDPPTHLPEQALRHWLKRAGLWFR